MWAVALMGFIVKFSEITLGMAYRERDPETGRWHGGFYWYVRRGLGKSWKWLGIFWAVILGCAMVFAPAVQANSVVEAIRVSFDVPGWIVGVIFAVIMAVVLVGGIKSISSFAEKVVPLMALAYVIGSIFILVKFGSNIPHVFAMIFEYAFTPMAATGGFAGSTVMLAIRWGLARGVYSNEAGTGMAPLAHSSSSANHPVKQGLVQSLSVYIDTLLICTCSAMMVLVFYVQDPETATALNGMPLVQMAVNNSVGEAGIHFITFAIFAFAFSSLIGNYFYAESNLRFIKGDSKALLTVFRIVCLVIIYFGAVNSFDLAWNLADIFMGLMAIMNLIAILLLGKWALAALDDYSAQRKAGKDPVFVADSIPGMPKTDCWHLEEVRDFGEPPVKEYLDKAIETDYVGLK